MKGFKSYFFTLNFLILMSLWSLLFFQISFEWIHNKQYEFGIFIPLIGFYALYLRFLDRPPAFKIAEYFKWTVRLGLFLIVLVLYPLVFIFETNVDWRLIAWSQGLLIFMASLMMLAYWGGWQWVNHFFGALLIFLFSIPWPKYIEIGIVKYLLYFVSYVVVDCLHLIGIGAVQVGNLIQLKAGVVSMEEACSGVRSFQSSIMLGYFLGELFRFQVFKRVFLLMLGAIFAIFFNIVRTLLLALFVNIYGSQFVNNWHNLASNTVFLACLFSLIICTWILKSYFNYFSDNKLRKTSKSIIDYFGSAYAYLIIALIVGVLPTSYIWYNYKVEKMPFEGISWKIDWMSAQSHLKGFDYKNIPLAVEDTLVYDEGIFTQWEENSYSILAYYFHWNHPKKAQLGGFHGPELCLPSSGWGLPVEGDHLNYVKDGIELIFRSFLFIKEDIHLYVFFTQWDSAGYPYYEKEGRMRLDRLLEVWQRRSSKNKTNFEFIIWGVEDFNKAKLSLINFLDAYLIVEKNENF